YRHLAGVIAGSRHTATEVPRTFAGQRFYLPENGVDPARFALASGWPEPQGRFRFVTVGRLVPYKGVDLTLEALHRPAALKACVRSLPGPPRRPAWWRCIDKSCPSGERRKGEPAACVFLSGWRPRWRCTLEEDRPRRRRASCQLAPRQAGSLPYDRGNRQGIF